MNKNKYKILIVKWSFIFFKSMLTLIAVLMPIWTLFWKYLESYTFNWILNLSLLGEFMTQEDYWTRAQRVHSPTVVRSSGRVFKDDISTSYVISIVLVLVTVCHFACKLKDLEIVGRPSEYSHEHSRIGRKIDKFSVKHCNVYILFKW